MRVVRRLLQVLVLVLTLVVGAAAAALVVSQTSWFKDWLRGYLERQANEYLNGRLSIERLGGNLFLGVELENIALSMDGSEVVAVQDIGLDYNVFEMIAQGISIDEIRLNKPVVYLRREGNSWSIARLIKEQEQEADREGPWTPFAVEELGISDGTIVVQDPAGIEGVNVPERVERLDAKLGFRYEPVRYVIEIGHVSFRTSEPRVGLNALSGTITVIEDRVEVDTLALRTEETSLAVDGSVDQYLTTPTLDLSVSSDKFSLPEIGRIVPVLAGIALQPAFEVNVDGPMDRMDVGLNVRTDAGQLSGDLTVDAQAPRQAARGSVSVRHLNLTKILAEQPPTDLTADLRLDVAVEDPSDLDTLSGSASLSAPRVVFDQYTAENVSADVELDGRQATVSGSVSAYGATATTQGRVTIPAAEDPLAYDLRGRLRGVDLRRLPAGLGAPRAATDVSASYSVQGREPLATEPPTGRRQVSGSAQFEPSSLAGAEIVDGSTVRFNLNGEAIGYAADVTVTGVNLERIGREFDVAALAEPRFDSSIDLQIAAEGRGTTPETIDLTASGTISDASLLGGRIPKLTFDATVADDVARVEAEGMFADFNPAVASGREDLEGSVGGALDVSATVTGLSEGVTVDSVDARAVVTLDRSTVGGLTIDQAVIDADYADSSGVIRKLEITGRDLNMQASGTLALNDTGQSNLTLQVDSPSLSELGKLADIQLEGIARIDATITGNRSELQATGKLSTDGLAYGDDFGALSLESDFTASIPELDVEQARVTTDAQATFATVAGQEINELQASATYSARQLEFEAQAAQPERALEIGAEVTLLPEAQEVRLRQLALDSGGVRWELVPGSGAIEYGGEVLKVEGLRLANGAQGIAVDGTFGRPGDALEVSLTGVDLATVDALLLREPQLTGRLDAAAKISGTTAAPRVSGTFQIDRGSFRQFEYDTLGGEVQYTPEGVTVDARLQQNPTQWFTAKGFVPASLFSGAAAGEGEEPAAAGAHEIDLTIDSSPIDLGLVQGFTTAVTGVEGTLEAHVRLTGTADNPRPDGVITIQNGALTVQPTGVPYTNIAGQLDLQPDRIRIDQITVLDNQFSALSVTGELAIDRRQVEGVQLYITAEDFKVIDNELGNIRIESTLEVAGDLLAPRVQGYLGVNSGEINLDAVIALAGTSPYPVNGVELEPEPGLVAADKAGAPAAADAPAAAAAPVDAAAPGAAPAGGEAAADAEAAEAGLFSGLTMDVQVILPNALVVRADSLQPPGTPISLGALNLTLGGDINATKERNDTVRLRGAVNTVRGTYDFQGRRFEIMRDGSVRFVGLEEMNPTLDIRTRRVIQGIETFVTVRGSLREPEIILTSSPPLEDADILSLIVFNQPVNQLGSGQQVTLAQRAQALATGAVASQLSESIENALNLDVFELNLAPEAGGAPELTIGQQVSDDLYLRIQQGIGDQSQTNVILEYQLTNWLRLQTNVLQGSSTQQSLFQRAQGSGVDLFFFFSY